MRLRANQDLCTGEDLRERKLNWGLLRREVLPGDDGSCQDGHGILKIGMVLVLGDVKASGCSFYCCFISWWVVFGFIYYYSFFTC